MGISQFPGRASDKSFKVGQRGTWGGGVPYPASHLGRRLLEVKRTLFGNMEPWSWPSFQICPDSLGCGSVSSGLGSGDSECLDRSWAAGSISFFVFVFLSFLLFLCIRLSDHLMRSINLGLKARHKRVQLESEAAYRPINQKSKKKKNLGLGFHSVLECLPSVNKVPGFILTIKEKKKVKNIF